MRPAPEPGDLGDPPQRADAVRNRARILDAAAAAFAAHGRSVSIEQIARDAGVGAGTVYRHFASRHALLQGIVTRRVDELAAWAQAADGPPADVLFEFVEMLGRAAVNDEVLTGAIAEESDDGDAYADAEASFMALLDGLVAAAHASGELRADVSTAAVKAMIVGQRSVARTGDAAAAAAHLAVLERGARSSTDVAS